MNPESQSNNFFPDVSRSSQQSITPTAVKTRFFAQNTSLTNVATATSAVLANGDRAVFIITIASNTGDDIMAGEVYISLYVDSVAAANLLPGGSGVDESKWQVQGPFYYFDSWNGKTTQAKLIVVVRNLTAGNHAIVLKEQAKYISNRPKAS